MKNFGSHMLSWVTILFLLTGSFLYPYWIVEGYLEDWYLKIMVFIATYGGLIGNIIWYINFIKNNK